MPACRTASPAYLNNLGGILLFLSILLSPFAAEAEDTSSLFIQQRLEQLYFEEQDKIGQEPIYSASYLLDLYRKNQFQLLWTNQDNISQLMTAISASAEEGLIPDDYHLKAITRYDNELKEALSMAKMVEYDLLLSDAMILLGQHKRYGKVNPREVEEKHNLEPDIPRSSPSDTYIAAIKAGTADWQNPLLYLIYFVGPFIGAIVAVGVYQFFAMDFAKVEEDDEEEIEVVEEVEIVEVPVKKPAARKSTKK